MRIFIDTSCLRSNILRHSDRKSQKEVTALEQLAERYSLFGSSLTLREVMATTSASQRDSLIVDYNTLQRIPKDEKVLGFHSNGSIVYPLVQDYQDETLRKELIEAGLTPKPYRQWLEQRFPNLRIRLPSELLNELAAPPSAALWHG